MSICLKSLRVVHTIAVIGVFLWPMALLAPMLSFDAPGSEDNQITLVLAFSLWLYPVPVLITRWRFLKAYESGSTRDCLWYCVLSITGYLAIALSLVALEIRCDGQFACV